jgi:serine protease AprX
MRTAFRSDDLIASYSSKGPTLLDHIVKPDIVAPGNQMISLVASKSTVASNSTVNRILYSEYQKTSSKSYSGDYYKLSGTSMAAATVSGTAALMLHNDWSLTPDSIKARLMRSATKAFPTYSVSTDPLTGIQYTSQYDVFTVGAGYLDVWSALNETASVDFSSTAASPSAIYDAAQGTVRIVNTDTSIWGKAAVWGTAAVWGSAAVWGTSVFVDGQAAVWGSSAIWGSAAVWGTSNTKGNVAIWGTAAVWGTSTKPAGESLTQLINGDK